VPPKTRPATRKRVPRAPTPRREPRRASPKVLLIGAAVVVAAVVGIVVALTLSGGTSTSSTTPLPNAATVRQMLAGIPQHGNVLGAASAPVTMQEYLDPQCPYCRQFETHVFPNLLTKYVRAGKVKVEVRILGFIGPDSVRGRQALIAAGEQNKLFQMLELLYEDQGVENTGWLSQKEVERAASSIAGLDRAKLLAAMGSSAVTAQASRFDAEAQAAGVNSTPTILVGKSGGKLSVVNLASDVDETAVDIAIAKAAR